MHGLNGLNGVAIVNCIPMIFEDEELENDEKILDQGTQ